jgi:hypothetical protein
MRKGGRYAFGQALLVLLTGPTHSAEYGFGFGFENDKPTAFVQVEICPP